MADNFEMISTEEMKQQLLKTQEDKIDREWAERISTVPVGAGWKMTRPEEESQRNFKRRINAAAGVSYRTLDWYPQETNLPAGTDAKTFVVRVKSIDLKAKQAAEAATAQNSQNGTSNGQQPAGETPSGPNSSPEGEVAGGRRRA